MSLILQHPVIGPTSIVTLRSAEFGDVRRVDTNVQYNRTRAGELYCVKDPIWPVTRTNVYSSLTNDRATVDLFKSFVEDTAGLQILLGDHFGDLWIGVITTPVFEIVTQRDDCWYDISFEFLGEKQ